MLTIKILLFAALTATIGGFVANLLSLKKAKKVCLAIAIITILTAMAIYSTCN